MVQGCCSYGAHFSNRKDRDHVVRAAKELSDDEWQFAKAGRKKGIYAQVREGRGRQASSGARASSTTRASSSTARVPGRRRAARCTSTPCARGRHHSELKPEVCWQLPLRRVDEEQEDGTVVSTLIGVRPRRLGRGRRGLRVVVHRGARGVHRAASPCTGRWARSCARCSATKLYRQVVAYLDERARLEAAAGVAPGGGARCSSPSPTRHGERPQPAKLNGRRDVDFGPARRARARADEPAGGARATIATDDWFRPTPAKGWDVRDTVAHLADIDEIAIDTCLGGPRPLNDFARALRIARGHDAVGCAARATAVRAARCWRGGRTPRRASATCSPASTPADARARGVSACARRRSSPRGSWRRGRTASTSATRSASRSSTRDRLRHVAWLGLPRAPVRVLVRGPRAPAGRAAGRAHVTVGRRDVGVRAGRRPNRITGPAGEFCRLFVQRHLARRGRAGSSPRAMGAVAALEVARAFL